MTKDYADYRKSSTEKGLEFQDYVVDLAWQNGLAIAQYSSRKYQYDCGESLTGVEIKYDIRSSDTGNLCFEVEEKAEPRPGAYAPSGVFSDGHWLYAIGDYEAVYIFSTRQLRKFWDEQKHRSYKTDTSRGFLIPKEEAKEYALKVLRPKMEEESFNGLVINSFTDLFVLGLQKIGKDADDGDEAAQDELCQFVEKHSLADTETWSDDAQSIISKFLGMFT